VAFPSGRPDSGRRYGRRGWVQREGGDKKAIKAGDVVWTPPGVKHWHGATAAESMTHIAIQESVGGTPVHWLEKVNDEQYGAR
jgi:quercetin dioxygenase-like cupin family protein